MSINGMDDYFIPETTKEMSKDIEKLTRGKGTDLGDLATEVVKQLSDIILGIRKVSQDFLQMMDLLIETKYLKHTIMPEWLKTALNDYRERNGKSRV